MEFHSLVEPIHQDLRPRLDARQLATESPKLAKVDSRLSRIGLLTTVRTTHRSDRSDVPFSIQTISNVFSRALAMRPIADDS